MLTVSPLIQAFHMVQYDAESGGCTDSHARPSAHSNHLLIVSGMSEEQSADLKIKTKLGFGYD